ANDVYNNGSTVSVTIENATGGNFEQLTPNPTPAQTTINDSVDTTTATLTASPSVTEGGVITYTVTLSNPAQTPGLGINSAVDATGATFENLQLGGAASVQVTDTTDEVVAKLTATPSVTEGGEITYTITLTNKDGLPINNHSALTFTLSD
ncbi:immunoglobulin-like domain-containing protein, partial [Pseudomonas sp. DCB_BG]|uniref:immunoglobulin-like domain-containing protein n=1 Tax=Pseudomonas sp. DCB_BG TaxID=2993595 RepID=UPI002248C960